MRLPLEMQVKLLRFLETREIMRVGGKIAIKLDVRLIAATNRDLNQAIEKGIFRNDLYFRIKVVTLHVPPLRERKEDIPLLVSHFVQQFSSEHHKTISQVSPDAMEILVKYPWPGNVRELKNLIENLVIFSTGNSLNLEDLPEDMRSKIDKQSLQPDQSRSIV